MLKTMPSEAMKASQAYCGFVRQAPNRVPVGRVLGQRRCQKLFAFSDDVLCRLRPSPQGKPVRGVKAICAVAAEAAPPVDGGTVAAEVEAALLAHYKKLQNGSDIRGVAIEGVEGEPLTLTASSAYFIGKAFAAWLAQRAQMPTSALRVAVGRDPRLSGPVVAAALAAGMAESGMRVVRVGLSTTPAMFMACVLPDWLCDGAIMVTASHLPFNRNGMKFFTAQGGLEKGDISDIVQRAARVSAEAGVGLGAHPGFDVGYVMTACLGVEPALVEHRDLIPAYAAYMQDIIKQGVNHPQHYDTPLEGFRIVVNAGNGGGGFFTSQVLQPLGADTTGSLHLQPDGTFPHHPPNPEDKRAMAATVEAVLRHKADLGIVFDTDVDRSGVVDGDGTVINKNRYIALMAAITLRDHPGTTIVTCSTTSNGLTDFIHSLGGRHFRFRKGYRNVIGKGMELNEQGQDTQLMMETSGHGAMRENFFLDDGAYAAVKIVVQLVRRRLEGGAGVGDLLHTLREPAEAAEFRIRITAAEGTAAGEAVLAAFEEWVRGGAGGAPWEVEPENYEGLRVVVEEGEGRRGWLLLRTSLHDPQMVLNVESEVKGGVIRILRQLECFLETVPQGQLNLDPIFKALTG